MYGPGTKSFEARSPARQYQGGKTGVRTALTVPCHSSTAEGYKCYILRAIFLRGFSAPLVGIHRCFIALRYRRGCPATATRVLCKPSFPHGRRVRAEPSSWLCYANIRLSPVLGSPPFSDSGVSGRSYAREDCGEVIVGCPGPLNRTRHKGLMWTAARRPTAAARYR
jgi:hypothetical protein